MYHNIAPHGIRSLSPIDPEYKNQHNYGSRKGTEHPDFSYHNGDVWLWLTGPVIDAACLLGEYHIAQDLFDVLLYRIIERGAVGTLAEIMDGIFVKPYGNGCGTITQAWSLAEFLRIIGKWGKILKKNKTINLSKL